MTQSSITKFPARFGKYILLDRINSGGMAEVYRGKVTGVEEFQRLVAIKCMLPALLKDEQFVTMFIDEAKLSSQLSHANIVQIYELGSIDERLYIAMELISGRDLRHVVKAAKRKAIKIPFAFAAYVISKAAEGLDFAHHAAGMQGEPLNIVHRDVSPQNIMVSYDGETKVMDFGIAKAEERATETRAGVLKGKFAYMAPEQVMGQPLDARADIFALGAVLYETLTAEKLFTGESDLSILDKVRSAKVPDFSVKIPGAPAELLQPLKRALARDVDRRFARASDFAEALEPMLIEDRKIFGAKKAREFMLKLYADEITELEERNRRYVGVTEADCGGDSAEPRASKTQIFESTFSGADLDNLIPPPAGTIPLGRAEIDGTQANVELDPRTPPPELAAATLRPEPEQRITPPPSEAPDGIIARPRMPTGEGDLSDALSARPRMPSGDGDLRVETYQTDTEPATNELADDPGDSFFEEFVAPTIEMDPSMRPLPPTALGDELASVPLLEPAPLVVPKPIVFASIALAAFMMVIFLFVIFDSYGTELLGASEPEASIVTEVAAGQVVEVPAGQPLPVPSPVPSAAPMEQLGPQPGVQPAAAPVIQPGAQPGVQTGDEPAPGDQPGATAQPDREPPPATGAQKPERKNKKQYGFIFLRVVGSKDYKIMVDNRNYKVTPTVRLPVGPHTISVVDKKSGKTGNTKATVTVKDTKKKPQMVRVTVLK